MAFKYQPAVSKHRRLLGNSELIQIRQHGLRNLRFRLEDICQLTTDSILISLPDPFDVKN